MHVVLSKALLQAGNEKASAFLQLRSHCNTHPRPWGSRGFAATPGTALPASGRAGGQWGWRGSSSFHLTSRPRAANEESGLWFLWQLVFPKIQNKGPEGPILLPAPLLPGVPCWECKIQGEKCIKPMSRLGAWGVLPLQAPPHSPICSQKAAPRRLCPPHAAQHRAEPWLQLQPHTGSCKVQVAPPACSSDGFSRASRGLCKPL